MSLLSRRVALVVLLSAVAGCSTVNDAKDTVGGWLGSSGGSDNTLNTTTSRNTGKNTGPLLKYGATLRVNKYVDQRKVGNPRLLGKITVRVMGISGNELLMDQDVATIATTAMKKRFDSEGFQVMEGSSASNALFEVNGVVKELTLDVKERD